MARMAGIETSQKKEGGSMTERLEALGKVRLEHELPLGGSTAGWVAGPSRALTPELRGCDH